MLEAESGQSGIVKLSSHLGIVKFSKVQSTAFCPTGGSTVRRRFFLVRDISSGS